MGAFEVALLSSPLLNGIFIVAGSLALLSASRRVIVRALARRGIPDAGRVLWSRDEAFAFFWGIDVMGLGIAHLVPQANEFATLIAMLALPAALGVYYRHRTARTASLYVMVAMLGMLALSSLAVSIGSFLSGDPGRGAEGLAFGIGLLLIVGYVAGFGQRLARRHDR